eukprot:896674-Pyramimonas_sp.AAC.1
MGRSKRALPSRIEGVAISSSAGGGGRQAEGGGSATAAARPADGRRRNRCASKRDAKAFGSSLLGSAICI